MNNNSVFLIELKRISMTFKKLKLKKFRQVFYVIVRAIIELFLELNSLLEKYAMFLYQFF